MMNKMKQLQQMQKQMEEIKANLDNIKVTGEVENGKVKVECTANRTITDIHIDEELIKEGNAEQIEELLVVAANQALDKAEGTAEQEMRSVAGGMLGNLGL